MLLIRIELVKARTVSLTYGLLGTSVVLTALFSVLAASVAGTNKVAALSTAAGLDTVSTATGFAVLLAAVFGVTVMTGEFRHGTVTLTFLSFPDRTKVLFAKAAASAVVGAIFGLVSGLAATAIGLAFAAAKGDAVALSAATLAGHVAGAALGAALMAAAGCGLGALVRTQFGAVIGVIAWGVVAESIIGGLFPSVRPYLPYAAATTLGGTALGQALGVVVRLASGPGPLPFAVSAGLVLGVAVVLTALAARITVPQDVT